MNSQEYKIFIYERSLGTSPAIYLASKRKVDILIVISAFESSKAIENEYYAKFLLSNILKSTEYF